MFLPAQIIDSFARMIYSVQIALAGYNVQNSPLFLFVEHKATAISIVCPVAEPLLAISHVDHVIYIKNNEKIHNHKCMDKANKFVQELSRSFKALITL